MSGVARGWAEAELTVLAEHGLQRVLEPIDGPQGPSVQLGGRTLVNFSSNDYLGLAADSRLAEAAAEAARRFGSGSGASRLVVGDTAAHRSLEAALAEFEGAESALLFNSGYAANVGVISALLGPEDVVFSDALNHASIIDGCRLSRARIEVYPHLDVAALEAKLASATARRKLVVTDSVFSMDGDVAPLPELVAVCERYGAALMVDEAHATGVLGENGGGACEHFGLHSHRGQKAAPTGQGSREPSTGSGFTSRVDIRMGTLGKALGSFGAYVLCDAALRELLYNRARSLVFSTSLPPPVCAAAERAVRIVREEPERRARLWRNIRHFADGLRRLGLAAEARSAIFPVVLGTPERALAASAALRERGVLVKAIRPPTVPKGTSRLRFALSAAHELSELDLALDVLAETGLLRP